MKTTLKDISYGNEARQVGDLHLPQISASLPPVLLIHGGGWNALCKESLDPLVDLFVSKGQAVFNINYRLLQTSPWPACGNDCLDAARFLLSGKLTEYGLSSPERIVICGASAGGHLAMMTGLRLPRNQVERIVSLAGPSRIHSCDDSPQSAISQPGFQSLFFGKANVDESQVREASPVHIVKGTPPPLTCIHSINDRLVPPIHSEEAVGAWKRHGGDASIFYFNGLGRQHGFWDVVDETVRQPIPELRKLLLQVIPDCATP
jgi:acetyl esterase/lipase